MVTEQQNQIDTTLNHLFNDSKNDQIKIMKGFSKSLFRSIQPDDFKDAYLSISKEQGEGLKSLIIKNDFKNIVEFAGKRHSFCSFRNVKLNACSAAFLTRLIGR